MASEKKVNIRNVFSVVVVDFLYKMHASFVE